MASSVGTAVRLWHLVPWDWAMLAVADRRLLLARLVAAMECLLTRALLVCAPGTFSAIPYESFGL